jgi:PIN domain nuclease of toxin-antitoxin system
VRVGCGIWNLCLGVLLLASGYWLGPFAWAIADPANLVVVSAVSAWEISIKRALGKLAAPDDLEHQLQVGGFTSQPITIAHGIAAARLARHHDDPFDRMLIAQAIAEGLTIVTRDKRFGEYNVALLPA